MKFESAIVQNQDQREIAPKRWESAFVILPIDNIDTDQIIPARFLKTISKVSHETREARGAEAQYPGSELGIKN